jgi:hypothetical protein
MGVINRAFSTRVNQKTSALYKGTLRDEDGVAIDVARISALTLKLYTRDAPVAVINSVDGVSILNTGRGTIDSAGLVKIQLTPDDNPIVVDGRAVEYHVMLIKATYDSTKQGSWTVSFPVYDVDFVP